MLQADIYICKNGLYVNIGNATITNIKILSFQKNKIDKYF